MMEKPFQNESICVTADRRVMLSRLSGEFPTWKTSHGFYQQYWTLHLPPRSPRRRICPGCDLLDLPTLNRPHTPTQDREGVGN